MNNEMLSKLVRSSVYELKPQTKASYYFKSGTKLLPNRLSIIIGTDCTPVNRSGRGLLPKVGQIKGQFSTAEESAYKRHKPYFINTSVWNVPGLQRYFYGTIGLTGPAGSIDKDCGDLAVIFTNDWQQVQIHIFKGLAQPAHLPEYLKQAVMYLQSHS